ncbi:monovalent cation:proton antiporter-2 (CPA2) family protein [Prosthecobacter sp.]|uniref:monovalent cation:proton antiporter-2 (CPA2) family protein n=1 Tax=Prosthecobacter sp. TaxID=1965333 RepID=UPI0024878BB3|nr:monovalent cation:proton antiporter-2 (CPA2) family protein [Prosthecobacter sp.]MDI1312003.1 monovalent cation:proton antiporter-2 (CPA2) family protein [Prosthecobacter sp.]
MHAPHFFLSAFIYLGAAVLLVPIAHRLGLGSVLGYLIGGAIIGPFALGWVGGAQGEEAMHFAEFGVVIMLFMIGLELEPSRLWRMRGPIFGLGGLQVSLTILAVMGIAMACGLETKPSIAIGMILALSSTAIVIQTLQEKALMRTDGGSDSFAVLLFQDISVIPMLAVFPLLAASGTKVVHDGWLHDLPHWAQPLVTLGAVVAIVIAGQFLVPRGFAILAKTGLRELLTAAALLLIVGVALLMTQVGLSPALGAFVAGVVLAGSHYRHELESNLEPFKGLLLGLFFLAVGASLDFTVIAGKPLLVAALVAGLIALKAAVIFVIATLLKICGSHRWLLALALAQGGEFAFALLSMAMQQNILGAETAKLLVAVVALSMAIAPLLFIIYERLIAPRYTAVSKAQRAPDPIDEHAPVILAGFGRFGNFVGRIMMSQGVKVTVLESDPDHVEMLRKFGFKVFYGDATRLDLLHAAGIEQACMLIIALADQAKVAQLIADVRERFPKLRILARAHDYDHRVELMRLGLAAEDAVHEQMGSAQDLAVRALRALGKPAYATERAARRWRRYDDQTFHLLIPVHEDEDAYASIVRERRVALTQLFEKDIAELPADNDQAWEIGRAEET